MLSIYTDKDIQDRGVSMDLPAQSFCVDLCDNLQTFNNSLHVLVFQHGIFTCNNNHNNDKTIYKKCKIITMSKHLVVRV